MKAMSMLAAMLAMVPDTTTPPPESNRHVPRSCKKSKLPDKQWKKRKRKNKMAKNSRKANRK